MKPSYFISVVSVLAATIFAAPVDAAPGSPAKTKTQEGLCRFDTGLPADPGQALSLVDTCLKAPPLGVTERQDIAADLRLLTVRHRERAGLAVMEARGSLDAAAQFHAMDMATRGYVGHADPEGRGHDWRIALTEREALVGAVGASITVLPADKASAMLAFRSLGGDPVNRANLDREVFDMTGVGVAQAQGKVFVVQLFADRAGTLSAPLAASGPGESIDMVALNREESVEGWRLLAVDGTVMGRSGMARLSARETGEMARLEVIVSDGFTQRALAGPLARY